MLFDIIFIGNEVLYNNFKQRFPDSKYVPWQVDALTSFRAAHTSATTPMFWVVWDDVVVSADFNFDYTVESDATNKIHSFLNGKHYYDGVALYPTRTFTFNITPTEASTRKFSEVPNFLKTTVDIQASTPRPYDVFCIDNIDDYQHALKNTTTEMFWATSSNLTIVKDFDFGLYFSHDDVYDRNENHVFKNQVNNQQLYNGIFLLSKNKPITEKEILIRDLTSRKEWSVIASTPRAYDQFKIETYEDYLNAINNTTTEMFWMTSNNLTLNPKFNFNLYFTSDNVYDRNENHAFVHKVDGKDLYNGIFLLSKNKSLTKQEVNDRFPKTRKEWRWIASGPCVYDRFVIDTYEDYQYALENSQTELFWIVPADVEPINNFAFDLYFDHSQEYDRKMNHVFLNIDLDKPRYTGISLLSKTAPLTSREVAFRFVMSKKKEHNIVASRLKQYDIIFISYNEPNADANWQRLLAKYPRAQRVDGVKGIHQAHICAAELATTPMFWVVDGDSQVVDGFDFTLILPKYDQDIVHVWSSRNPVNGLEYGYGGVKLLPKRKTMALNVNSTDMTTSISSKFRAMPEVSNITEFNTDSFSTWRSAFRECVKLSSRIIAGQVNEETEKRLDTWCTVANGDYSSECILGACAGREYGSIHSNNAEALNKINDFNWLQDCYRQLIK